MDPLSSRERRYYARQLMLPQIGTSGQTRLCRTRAAAAPGADARAYRAAADYLQRAGVAVLETGSATRDPQTPPERAAPDARELTLPNAEQVSSLAGDPQLEDAAAMLAGAFEAVETIKAVVGAGKPASLPETLVLMRDPDAGER